MLPLEEPMEFETIDEREFPILTEDLSTTFSQEGITQLVEEVVPNNRSQDVNSPVVYTSASNEQTTFAKDAEVIVGQKTGAKKIVTINPSMNMEPTTEFSTPDRPSGPLLEEQFGTSEPASNKELHQSIESVRAQLITSEEVTETKANANTAISTLNKESNLQAEPMAELRIVDPLRDLSYQLQVIESTENNTHLVKPANENSQPSESTRDKFIADMEVVIVENGPNIERSTPDRPSGPLLEEPFSISLPNNDSNINTDVNDAKVGDITAHNECDSLEDITVYEVVT